jgi:hemerythrin
MDAAELLSFLHDWIVNHILVEDRRFATFINQKGVY